MGWYYATRLHEKLWQHTTSATAMGEISFTMPARGKIKPRQVLQSLWARRVDISAGQATTIQALREGF